MAIACFLLTQDEAGLFAIAAAFGFGFAGINPVYLVTVRELFPSAEASWRIPLVLFTAMSGMAVGSWLSGLISTAWATTRRRSGSASCSTS